MAVEVVVLVPVVVAVMLLVIAFGRYVGREGDVESAAREAARAASYERDLAAARDAAQQAATRTLPDELACQPVTVGGDFRAGGTVTVTVSCQVSFSELGFLGLPGSANLHGQSAAPLDTWRRTQ
ncbi:TadE/TadG family type IV pilus assembly protein [Phytoactinopolyspora halophila]|nr:TadE/TadG family type IV pilus assembly protein [Phytoactinopolyspora halophila]